MHKKQEGRVWCGRWCEGCCRPGKRTWSGSLDLMTRGAQETQRDLFMWRASSSKGRANTQMSEWMNSFKWPDSTSATVGHRHRRKTEVGRLSAPPPCAFISHSDISGGH